MPKDNGDSQEENLSVGNVIRLGRYWVAVVMPDGSLLLQHLSHVCLGGSGELIDLLRSSAYFDSAHHYMKDMDAERIGVRTLLLSPDGSVVTDPDAISPSGLLSDEAYVAIPPTQQSSVRYFSRKSNKTDW